MKKIKYLILIVLFLINIDVKAVDSCTTDEMARLKELANNVEFKYDYEIDEDLNAKNQGLDDYLLVEYKLKELNVSNDIRISIDSLNDSTNLEIINTNYDEINLGEGDKITFKIYSHTTNLCTDRLLRTVTITLPYYSRYYYVNKDKCLEYKDFEFCQELMDYKTRYTNEEIDELLKDYLEENNDSNNIVDITNFNYYYLIPIISFIVIVVILIVSKKKKNKDL